MTPNARTLAECRRRGWIAATVERRLPRGFTTVDLFGFIDIVALDGQPGLLAIQATSGDHGADRLTKIRSKACIAKARRWIEAGNRLEVWAWRKVGAPGARKLWEPRIVRVVLRLTIDETLRDLPI